MCSIILSVVIPARNEAKYIIGCVEALLGNPSTEFEVLVVDGGSTDATRRMVEEIARRDPRARLLDNPAGITPHALNLGVLAARGEYVAILGAHSEARADWVQNNIRAMQTHPDVAAVGGLIETISEDFIGRAIAAAMSSWFGVGDSKGRVGAKAGYVDHVIFGCYRRSSFSKYGLFDEAFIRNQDDEFSFRLIAGGERLFFDPDIRAKYYSRSTWPKAIRQYWGYGRYKLAIFWKHRIRCRARHLVPALWVIFLLTVGPAALVSPFVRLLFFGVVLLYVALGLAVSMQVAGRVGGPAVLFLPMAASLHMAYGLGTLWGLLRPIGSGGERLAEGLEFETNKVVAQATTSSHSRRQQNDGLP